METVAEVERNKKAKPEAGVDVKTSSAFSCGDHVADPVVYQLVRVEGDGRLVPATDDEVKEVENLLEDGKSKIQCFAGKEQIMGCISDVGFCSEKTLLKGSEGLLQSNNPDLVAEKANIAVSKQINTHTEEFVPSSAHALNDSDMDEPGIAREHSNLSNGLIDSVSSTSNQCDSWKPDFSKLQGEICLEKLSVKELHKTFKATFGRETTVKDKQWLKKRIAMGLTNSCDFSTTTLVIKDNIVVIKGREERGKDSAVAAIKEKSGGPLVAESDQMGNPTCVSGRRQRISSMESNCVGGDLDMEHKTAKRVRKPTRRYIEELSEIESRDYSVKSLVRNSGHGQLSPRSYVRPVQKFHSDGRPLVTRQDSLGGSGVQVPYVSQVRSSCPRKNIMALMKLKPSGMCMASRLVKKASSMRCPQPNSDPGNQALKARLASGWIQQPLIMERGRDKRYSETKVTEIELNHMDAYMDNSGDSIVTVPTANGGIRRKHHRPWTLSEVVKLVEGVARCGAGRWSEIKQLAFASYSYRTSVDLKDKWRNLLKASFAEFPAGQGKQNLRKHASIPIPAPILSRVRELAEVQAQFPLSTKSLLKQVSCT